MVAPGQLGQPRPDAIDLVGGDLADVHHVLLTRGEPPLRIESEADVRKGQELLVAHGLGEEVRVAGLQIEDHVEPGRPGRVDPRTDVVEGTLGRMIAVGARLRGTRQS